MIPKNKRFPLKPILTLIRLFILLLFIFLNFATKAQDPIPTITKLYAHIDKELYSPEEYVWFKVYAHNDQILDTNLQNVTVDFFSPDKKLIDHQTYLSYLSSAYGQFKIPKNYPFSVLTMVVYKNQLNKTHPNYFQKEIYVLNKSVYIIVLII